MNEISVLMAVFNGAEYIAEAIQSVLEQTFVDFELIIVDDGSTDKTKDFIFNFQDSRIQYYFINHSGLSAALNYGLTKCSANYIARIDADDIWMKNKLQVQIQFLYKYFEFDMIACSKQVIDSKGKIIVLKEPDSDMSFEMLVNTLKKYNCICHSSVIFRRSILDEVGYYNEKYKNSLDYEFWLRIVRHRKAFLIGVPLVQYRISERMLSLTKRQQQNYEVIKIKLREFGLIQWEWSYWKYMMFDVYRLLIPDFLIRIKKKIGISKMIYSENNS